MNVNHSVVLLCFVVNEGSAAPMHTVSLNAAAHSHNLFYCRGEPRHLVEKDHKCSPERHTPMSAMFMCYSAFCPLRKPRHAAAVRCRITYSMTNKDNNNSNNNNHNMNKWDAPKNKKIQ